ncbi:MAG: NfeD family protein [Salibacteraceae bacterium]
MTLTVIILIIVAGLAFVLAEILVLPGGVVGIMGFALMITGIYFAYGLDTNTGHFVLTGTLVLTGGISYMAFKSKTWKKATLHTNVAGKVNTLNETPVQPGDKGKTTSRLAPMGTAKINGHYLEVKSHVDYLDPNTPVEVVKIEGGQITVKPSLNE